MSEDKYVSTGEIRRPKKGEMFLLKVRDKVQILDAITDFQEHEYEIVVPDYKVRL